MLSASQFRSVDIFVLYCKSLSAEILYLLPYIIYQVSKLQSFSALVGLDLILF